MIALLPVRKGIAAVRADRIVGVRREQKRFLVWVDFAGSLEQYTLVAEEDAIRRAWNEFVEHHDTPSYVWDLTSFSVWDWTSWSESPAPEGFNPHPSRRTGATPYNRTKFNTAV